MSSNGAVGSSANPSYPADDMDAFFDFNQADNLYAPSETMSPTSKLSPLTVDPQNTFMSQEHADEHQTFTGPSHEYDRFHQQTGLPTGSVSAISAMNDFNQFSMGGYMDMDFAESPSMPSLMYQESSGMDDLINPAAIAPEQATQPMQRLRPGTHSQQAQQAKHEALARQQRQQQMGQQIMQQRNLSEAPTVRGNRTRSQGSADSAVDERISQLLDQMRQNGNAAADDGMSQDNNSLPSVLRNRKEEDDMDEDERLLASDEGKKLSSKERRQLRNKVSARAFRSRRKEYITQLEGEVAVKAQECNELKMRNRQLIDQNNQLTQLTQTLLRHPAFATFMDDMSSDPSLLATIQQQRPQAQVMQQQQQPANSRSNKDVNPNRPLKQEPQQDIHVGMTMVPDQHFDFSNLTLGNNTWNSNAPFNYQQPQVFALFETPALPNVEEITAQALGNNTWTSNAPFNYQQPQVFALFQTPALPNVEEITAQALSGKSSDVTEIEDLSKPEYPVINKDLPSLPVVETEDATSEVETDDSDFHDNPDFALYARSSAATTTTVSPCAIQDAARMLEQSLSGKVLVHFSLSVLGSVSEDSQLADIDRLFASERAVIKRVRAITSEYLQ